MAAPEEPLRPRAVTVIGWIWLVLAVFQLFKSLVNLVVWRMLQPDMPALFALDPASPPQLAFLRPLLEHLTALQATAAILSATVIVVSIELLRLRPWARLAMEALCWLAIAFVAAFSAFLIWLWGRLAALSGERSFGNIGLAVGLAFCFAVAAALAVTIALLRGSRVRAGFLPRPPEKPRMP